MNSEPASPVTVALQQPDWPRDRLRPVCEQLSGDVGPVDASSCRALHDELALASSGRGFVVVGGDCAESFDDASPARVVSKARHLHRIADRITGGSGVPATRIGRFGGQFAKPRSKDHEELADGRLVPSYRGDAVNSPDPGQRQADPARLLVAHRRTADAVQALATWDAQRRERLRWWRPASAAAPATYLGHEALLLDYERALLRTSPGGEQHASSGHYLWIGDRTRHPDHAHVAFAASVGNPVGVKIGPSIDPEHVRALAEILDPADRRRPGRLSFIVRMGAERCASALPPVIEALGDRAGDVLWILDPMHGNGRTNAHGQKTRLLADIFREIRSFFSVLTDHGLWPGGIHLEMTPDAVTECVDDVADLVRWLPAFRSTCDPRLDPAQAVQVAGLVAELLRAHRRATQVALTTPNPLTAQTPSTQTPPVRIRIGRSRSTTTTRS